MLDVGCGEGVLTHKWAQRLAPRRVVGIDLEDPTLQAEWEQRQAPEPRVPGDEGRRTCRSPTTSSTSRRAIEVLEHVPDPAHTVAEMARVAQRWLLVSVPREPLWRGLNMARGAYLQGPRQHPGARQPLVQARFVALLGRHGEVVEARSPFPWTMLLVRL